MGHVVVLAGGESNEREVSLKSGAAVANALRAKGHQVRLLDPAEELDEIIKNDIVFPALHGAGGEDGTIQAALESRGAFYIGSGVAASALCFDKWLYRRAMQAAGLSMPRAALVGASTMWQSPLCKQPFVLKPVQGGSTLDVLIVREPANVTKHAVSKLLDRYGVMLLEELIEGTELTVGVLGGQPLPAVEIIPPEGADFDYENKYNGRTQELCPAQHVAQTVLDAAAATALKAHQLAGCRDLSRSDFMIDKAGSVFLLETNTLPGMTAESLYPKEAKAAGLAFPDLCEKLVQYALLRKEKLATS